MSTALAQTPPTALLLAPLGEGRVGSQHGAAPLPTDELRHRALRFLTAGSVDDGKSTLIGRLLYDSRAILADQLEALEKRAAGSAIDLSLLTDGLEAEREQGITIDVAYRYFATRQRKFIIADAPGHEQYTRNMVTAAAGSDAAVVLVDITKLDWRTRPVKLLAQTRRHSLLAQLLRVPSIVFAINKLDAVDAHAQAAFSAVREALETFATQAGIAVAGIVPVSALRGDNVTLRSPLWHWHRGPTLLELLHALPATDERHDGALLIPVQYVAKQGEQGTGHQPRTVWGRIAHGRVRAGDVVQVFPSGQRASVAEVRRAGAVVGVCEAGQSAGLVLDRQLDISRGDWIASAASQGGVPLAPLPTTQRFNATLAWLDTEPAQIGRKYWLRHGHRWVQARITAIDSRRDIHTLAATEAHELAVNEIGQVQIETQAALPVEAYADNRVGGAMIVVDPATNRTSGALLVA
ncbi:GTP-binding protein [Methylibium sp.]|uniref:sulfate adenylyltransferase subunit 1 n=1 Tax=Methylibium sp. TaxID=2067992 RepID=UPI00286CD8AD|nr:GTP-binding protein [Methylibium sp.]